jgi:uncharacterized protein (TIGR03435 family)
MANDIVLAIVVAVGTVPALAQQGPAAFDVASVKLSTHPLTKEGYSYSDQKVVSPGRFQAINSNVAELVRWAYGLEEYQVVAPDWMTGNAITFDIEARAPGDTPPAQIRLMLQALLSDRLGLAFHRTQEPQSSYELLVDKGGPKLQRAAVDTPRAISFGRGSITTVGTSMARFAAALARELHCPVLDRTDLTGIFAVELHYAPPLSMEVSDGPSLVTAVQDLGLRLKSVKAPIEVLHIDHAGKIPKPN